MRHKKLKLSAVLLLGLGLSSIQAQTMFVKKSNGTQTAYPLNSIRKMTFSGGNATIYKTDNSTGVYALNGLRYLIFTDITGIGEQPMRPGYANLIAYPNPVADELNIDLTDATGNGTVSILSLDGRLKHKQKTKGTGIATINLSHLPQGVYICRYSNATEIKTVKIIKQ